METETTSRSLNEKREIQRKKFYEVISSDGRCVFNSTKLERYIQRVVAAKQDRVKSPPDYALLRRYDVTRIGEEKNILIKKNSIDPFVRFVPISEVFDVIYDAHVNVCHGGQKRTHYEVKKTVANVTREQIAHFLSYCITCEEKKAMKKSRRVIRPITSSGYGERGQVDLIDMRSSKSADGHSFILHYQDHFTKFSVLKALHTKQTTEVSQYLYDIFTVIGAPKILQSDNGNEFVGAPLKKMMNRFWPETELVQGSPRHPQSQGSVEKANCDVKKMLIGIMQDKSCSWVKLLEQVQWTKNTVYHRVIRTTPYEAVFGQKPTSSMNIKEQETDDEDLEETDQIQLAQQSPCNGQETDDEGLEETDLIQLTQTSGQETHHEDLEVQQITPPSPCNNRQGLILEEASEMEKISSAKKQLQESSMMEQEESNEEILSQRLQNFSEIRERVKDGIKQQANKMIQSTSSCPSPEPEINDCVNVTVPQVDRLQKISPRNFIGVIIGIKEIRALKLYDVATEYGRVRPLLCRNQFEVCSKKNIVNIETMNKEHYVSIRKIATAKARRVMINNSSVFCHCAKDFCKSMRCLCRRKGLACTERCEHGRDPKSGRINIEKAVNFCRNKKY